MKGFSNIAPLESRKKLMGLDTSSGNGQKRKASDAELASPATDSNPVWKRPPSGVGIPTNRQVHNPFEALKASKKSRTSWYNQNPSASRTVTSRKMHSQAVSQASSSKDQGIIIVSDKESEGDTSDRYEDETISRSKKIIIPSTVSNGTSGKRNTNVHPVSTVSEFLKIRNTGDRSRRPSKMPNNGLTSPNLEVQELTDYPSSPLTKKERNHIGTPSDTQHLRRMAGDGRSTERLRGKIKQKDSSSYKQSLGHSRHMGSSLESDPIEEFEENEPCYPPNSNRIDLTKSICSRHSEADSTSSSSEDVPAICQLGRYREEESSEITSSGQHSSSKSSSSHIDSKPSSRRNTTPHGTRIDINVHEMSKKFEKKPGIDYPDLKSAGKPRKTYLGANKEKRGLLVSASKSGNESLDKLATSKTEYSKPPPFLPVKTCIWGSKLKYQLTDRGNKIIYWLLWTDNHVLKLYEGPQPSSGSQPIMSLDLKRTNIKGIEIGTSTRAFLKITFEEDEYISETIGELDIVMFAFANQIEGVPCLDGNYGDLQSRAKELYKGDIEYLISPISVNSSIEHVLLHYQNLTRPRIEHPDIPNDALKPENQGISQVNSTVVRMKPRLSLRSRARNSPIEISLESPNQQLPMRRSGRIQGQKDDVPSENLEKVILVYPPHGAGAVNITVGDLRRLNPSEFLNDTLIELGLKFWLNDLRALNPERCDEIHVFSSFFFKKLANRTNKTPEEGYNSVRKWTAKVDIFRKKYIIVPINENVHWYLAIIYHPSHILDPATPETSSQYRSTYKGKNTAHSAEQESGIVIQEKHETLSQQEQIDELFDRHCPSDDEPNQQLADEKVSEGLGAFSIDDVSEFAAQAEHTSREGTGESLQLRYPVESDSSIQGQRRTISVDPEDNKDDEPELVGGGGPNPDDDDLTVDDSCEEDRSSDNFSNEEVYQLIDESDQSQDPSIMLDNREVVSPGQKLSPPASINNDIVSVSDDNMDIDDSFEANHQNANNRTLSDDNNLMNTPEINQNSSVSSIMFYGKPDYTHPLVRTQSMTSGPDEMDCFQYSDNNEDALETNESTLELANADSRREISEEVEVISPPRPRTYIFSLDSLGGGHPKALSRLNDYLLAEAKDKKGVENATSAIMRKVDVPIQPNSSDCGLYLIHFVRTFMSDPEYYFEKILASNSGSSSKKDTRPTMSFDDRRKLWKDEEVCSMREEMKKRILKESEEWLKKKTEKEKVSELTGAEGTSREQTAIENSSDDDVEVMEIRKKAKSPRKPSHRMTTRMRG